MNKPFIAAALLITTLPLVLSGPAHADPITTAGSVYIIDTVTNVLGSNPVIVQNGDIQCESLQINVGVGTVTYSVRCHSVIQQPDARAGCLSYTSDGYGTSFGPGTMRVQAQCANGPNADTGTFALPSADVASSATGGGTAPLICSVTVTGNTSHFWAHCHIVWEDTI